MNLKLTFVVAVLASPAYAEWQRVANDVYVTHLVQRKSVIWAVPSMSSSSDGGYTWSEGVGVSEETAQGPDQDAGPKGEDLSISRHGHLDVDGDEQAQTIAFSFRRARLLGKRVVAIGQPDDSEDRKDGVYVSDDLGRTWKPTLRDKVYLANDLITLGSKYAWIVEDGSNGPLVWRTSDAGESWKVSELNWSGREWDIFFLDKSRGWMLLRQKNGVQVVGTSDGGGSWKVLSWIEIDSAPAEGYSMQSWVAVSSEGLAGIVFADKNRGWVAGSGRLWSTRDGGASWSVGAAPDLPSAGVSTLFYGRKGRSEFLLYAVGRDIEVPEEDFEKFEGHYDYTGAIYRMELEAR